MNTLSDVSDYMLCLLFQLFRHFPRHTLLCYIPLFHIVGNLREGDMTKTISSPIMYMLVYLKR